MPTTGAPVSVGAGLQKVEVGRVLSWFEARDLAREMGGELPTTAELRDWLCKTFMDGLMRCPHAQK